MAINCHREYFLPPKSVLFFPWVHPFPCERINFQYLRGIHCGYQKVLVGSYRVNRSVSVLAAGRSTRMVF